MKRIKHVTLVAAATLVGGLALAGPAPAAQARPVAAQPARHAGTCFNPLHVYESVNYRGAWKKFCSSDRYLSNNKWPHSNKKINDSISSVKNVDGCVWRVYRNYAYRGQYMTFYQHKSAGDLRNTDIGNDTISSLKKYC
ncbi:hypothetical protein [Streptomyces naphthomycinicus]|uniref:hypothetical protein n=1 Tax=Streptomyces naphthomycinicus TaxID=2872625 RepID=UPI001CED5D01|nr:hypothetical protein [Streptomyces sp. TML10]